MTPTPDPFPAERPRLLGLAYRMLGSYADAEEVVAEVWLRWSAADHGAIERPAAWLTTVCSRAALDRWRILQRRREDYVGPWLPEPVAPGPGPEEAAELADSLTLGFLTLLDRLDGVERLVFLLAEVFGEPYSVIAEVTGRSEDACRQIASRARRRVRDERRHVGRPADAGTVAALVDALLRGDVDGVTALLHEEVVLVGDGGPRFRAARRPVVGPERVGRLLLNVVKRVPPDPSFSMPTVAGATAVVVSDADGPGTLLAADVVDGLIVAIYTFTNRDKLGHVSAPVPLI